VGVILPKLSGEVASPCELATERIFAFGASGSAGCNRSEFTSGVEASEEVGVGVVGLLGIGEESGKAVAQQTSMIAAKTMEHLRGRRTRG